MRRFIVAIMIVGLTSLSAYNMAKLENDAMRVVKEKSTLAKHKVIKTLSTQAQKSVVLVSSIIVDESLGCSACPPPKLSFFVFSKSGVLEKSYIDAVGFGSAMVGVAPSEGYKLIEIGEGKLAVQADFFTPARGMNHTFRSIFLLDDTLKEVLSFLISMDNSDTGSPDKEAWNSTMTFDKSKKHFYDIIVKKKGVKDNKPFEDKKVFSFDGEKYQ